jgi:hypothetical protein
MDAEQRTHILEQLAAAIGRHRLAVPARIALDVIAPVGFIASQVAQLVSPLTPTARWQAYVNALGDEQGWALLQQLVEKQDC